MNKSMVFSVIAIAVLMLITAPIMANHTFARSTTVSGKLVKVPPNVRPHPAFWKRCFLNHGVKWCVRR